MMQSKQAAQYPPCDCERAVIMKGGPAGALWPHEERCARRKAIVAAYKPAPKPAAPRAHRITPHCAPGCVDIEAQKPAAFECCDCERTFGHFRNDAVTHSNRTGHDVREVSR